MFKFSIIGKCDRIERALLDIVQEWDAVERWALKQIMPSAANHARQAKAEALRVLMEYKKENEI